MKTITKPYKITLALIELFFAIPILGALVIVSSGWSALSLLFILHAVGLIFSIKEGTTKWVHILGLIAVPLEFIPIVGLLLHLIIGILLLIDGISQK